MHYKNYNNTATPTLIEIKIKICKNLWLSKYYKSLQFSYIKRSYKKSKVTNLYKYFKPLINKRFRYNHYKQKQSLHYKKLYSIKIIEKKPTFEILQFYKQLLRCVCISMQLSLTLEFHSWFYCNYSWDTKFEKYLYLYKNCTSNEGFWIWFVASCVYSWKY